MSGMIGGQIVDLASVGQDISYDTLVYIHSHKTGALFEAAVRVAGIIAQAPADQIEAISDYADHLGLLVIF